jgi:hypothetical protein
LNQELEARAQAFEKEVRNMEDTQRKLETTISVTKEKISSERDAAKSAIAACAVSFS